jgi:hypothetical protein
MLLNELLKKRGCLPTRTWCLWVVTEKRSSWCTNRPSLTPVSRSLWPADGPARRGPLSFRLWMIRVCTARETAR